jgi:hypothetical protein
MRTQPAIERAPTLKATFVNQSTKVVQQKPTLTGYLRRIAQRLRVLQQLNLVESPTRFVARDELVRAWTVSYFLPMLKSKDTFRPERKSLREDGRTQCDLDGKPRVRLVAKPKKGLRLPRIFAPCKKFETPR